jgi:hypothetical protein
MGTITHKVIEGTGADCRLGLIWLAVDSTPRATRFAPESWRCEMLEGMVFLHRKDRDGFFMPDKPCPTANLYLLAQPWPEQER